MKKHIRVLILVSFSQFLVLLHTVYRAYEAEWFFKVGASTFLLLALTIAACLCVLWPYIDKLFFTKDKKY